MPIIGEDHYRTANKDHTCCGCLGTITTGTRYRTYCWSDDGELVTVKLCNKCDQVLRRGLLEDNYWFEGELKEFHNTAKEHDHE